MKKFIWTLAIIAVIAGSLTITAPVAVAQDSDGPGISSTQSQVEGVEHNEAEGNLPSLTQNWILMGVGFVLMVAPFIWWYIKIRPEEKTD